MTTGLPSHRPAFEPGNEMSTQHGGYSPRRVEPYARALVDSVLEDPMLALPSMPGFRRELWSWAQHAARADLLHAQLLAHGEECDGCEQCVSLEQRWTKHDTTASRRAARLGLDPVSLAQLHAVHALIQNRPDLAREWADDEEQS